MLLQVMLLLLAKDFLPNSGNFAGEREAKQALYCMITDKQNWLEKYRKNLTFRAVVDNKSYAGESHIIITATSKSDEGLVFDIRLLKKNSYFLVNNGSYTIRNNIINMKEAPLGGIWVQDFLIRNIRKSLMRHPIKHLTKAPKILCSSYIRPMDSRVP